MPFESDSTNFSLGDADSYRSPAVTDRDLLNELKRPIQTPDFSTPVMSRVERAFPGFSGRAGRRQAFAWRSGIAAALALAATVGLYCGVLQNDARNVALQNAQPRIAKVIETFEEGIEPGRVVLTSFHKAANEVALRMAPAVDGSYASEQAAQAVGTVELMPTMVQRRRMFPVANRYWSHPGTVRQDFGYLPRDNGNPVLAEISLQGILHKNDAAKALEEWKKAHPNALPTTTIGIIFGVDPDLYAIDH